MDLVKIAWHDACDMNETTWASKDEMNDFASKPCLIESVGWMYKKTKAYITICGDLSLSPDTHGRVTKIPRKMIVKVEVLQVVPAASAKEGE